MKFALTTEQEQLRGVLRRFVADRTPLSDTRDRLDDAQPFDRAIWATMATELGLQGVDTDDELGGAGLSAVELALSLEELGAALYAGPYLASTGFALGVLLAARYEVGAQVSDLITAAAEGRVLAVAVPDHGGAWLPASVATVACAGAHGWTLIGTKEAVLHANAAEVLLVAARTPDQSCAVFAVDPGSLDIQQMPSIDPTRSLCRVTLDSTPARLLVAAAEDVIVRASHRAALALAAESLGAARRCLETTSAYAMTRVQFGRPIGSFQVIKHQLADLLVDVELATSAVYLAACHVAAGDHVSAAVSAPMALFVANQVLARAARDSVHVHGGIGFTWEHDAHLYVKRGQANRQLLGRPGNQLDAIYELGGVLA